MGSTLAGQSGYRKPIPRPERARESAPASGLLRLYETIVLSAAVPPAASGTASATTGAPIRSPSASARLLSGAGSTASSNIPSGTSGAAGFPPLLCRAGGAICSPASTLRDRPSAPALYRHGLRPFRQRSDIPRLRAERPRTKPLRSSVFLPAGPLRACTSTAAHDAARNAAP